MSIVVMGMLSNLLVTWGYSALTPEAGDVVSLRRLRSGGARKQKQNFCEYIITANLLTINDCEPKRKIQESKFYYFDEVETVYISSVNISPHIYNDLQIFIESAEQNTLEKEEIIIKASRMESFPSISKIVVKGFQKI